MIEKFTEIKDNVSKFRINLNAFTGHPKNDRQFTYPIKEQRKAIEIYSLFHSVGVTTEFNLTSFQNYLQSSTTEDAANLEKL